MTPSAPDKTASQRSDVFISYSRKDREFVLRLEEALESRGRETWVDWQGIRPAEEFLQAIFPAIEGTDTFVFVLSPDSVTSEICGKELAHAVSHNKRMIPIIAREVDAKAVPEPLAKLNWVFARDADSFEAATDFLISALDTDLGWVRAHTRLLTRAIEWEAKAKSNSFVLRGEDLRAAEQWLAQAGTEKERQPTALQTEYIIASRKASSKRQRVVLAAVTFGAVVAVVLAIVAMKQRTKAVANAQAAEANALEASRQRDAAMDALSQSYFSQGTRLVDEQQSARALAFLAAAVRNNGHQPAAARIATLLTDRVWPKLLATQRAQGTSRAFFSPNGTYVVAVLPNGHSEIREANSGKRLSDPITYHLRTGEAYFSPDGEYVVITTGEGNDENKAARSYQLWKCQTGRPLSAIFPCAREVFEVSFSADSRRFAFCSADGTDLWDVTRSKPVKKLKAARTARFSSDGARLVTVDVEPGAARVWDGQTGIAIGKPISGDDQGSITLAAFSPDGQRIVTALTTDFETGALRVWDATTGTPLSAWVDQDSGIANVIFSPDGHWFVSNCRATAQVFASLDGKPISTALSQPTGAQILDASFSPDGGRIATAGADGSVCVWHAEGGHLAGEMWEQRALERVGFSDDCRTLITTSDSGRERRAWSILRGIAQPQPLPTASATESEAPPNQPVEPKRGGTLKTSDGRLTFALDIAGSVRIRNAANGNAETDLQNLPEWVVSAEFSPDGTRILVSGKNEDRETVGLWDVASGKLISESITPDPDFKNGGFSPDSSRLVVFGERLLHILDTRNGKEIVPAESMAGAVQSISFTSDSKLFATAGAELQIWNAQNGQALINPIKAPRENYFTTVAFNRDGRRFVASTLGGHHEADQSSSQLFHTVTGVPLSDIHKSGGNGGRARFDSEDRTIVEGSGEQWQWDAPPEQPPPRWLAELAEATAGQRLSGGGILELIDPEAALAALEKTLATEKQDDAWLKQARWVLAEASARTISPFSAMRVSDYVERGIRSEEGGDLEKAQLAAPDNALVHARLGLRHLGQDEQVDTKAKVLADHETLLAIKLGPASAQAWQARAKVLIALERPAEAAAAAQKAVDLPKQ